MRKQNPETLSDLEAQVFMMRTGVFDGRPRTLEQVGRMFSITRIRVRLVEAKGFRHLRFLLKARDR